MTNQGHLLLEHRKPMADGTGDLGRWSVIAGAKLDDTATTRGHQIAALLELGVQLAVRAADHPDPRAFRLVHHHPAHQAETTTGLRDRPATETVIWWAGQAAAPAEIAHRLTGGGQ